MTVEPDTPYASLLNHVSGLLDGSVTEFDTYLVNHSLPALAGIKKQDGQRLANLCYQALLAQTDVENISGIAKLLSEILQYFSFDEILAFEPPVDFIGGLNSPLEPFRLLVLTVLEIAAKNGTDARKLVKDKPDVVRELITFWLTTDASGQAEHAARILVRMLRSDQADDSSARRAIDDGIDRISISSSLPSGPVWKEIFENEETFFLFLKLCQADPDGGKPSRADASIARGRLLDWIPEVAQLNWFAVAKNPIKKSTNPQLENFPGLIQFGMQDLASSDDPLSALVAIKSLVGLLRIREDGSAETEESSLNLFKSLGIHDRLISQYMAESQPGSLEAQLVLPAAVDYFTTFLRQYPDLFVGPNAVPSEVQLLSKVFDMISKDFVISLGQWALIRKSNFSSSTLPKLLLHLDVLQSVPRSILYNKPVPGLAPRAMSVLLKVPINAESAEAVFTLGTIFHGPTSAVPSGVFDPNAGKTSSVRFVDFQTEATASRDLYFAYITRHPNTWSNVVEHASRSLGSNKDLVFAALRFIRQIITAEWGQIENGPDNQDAPLSGPLAILAPATFQRVMPYLLNKAPSNAQTIAGSGPLRSDDPDHHALHRLVTERFDLLRMLKAGLQRDAKRFSEMAASPSGKSKVPAVVARIPAVLKEIEAKIEQGPWNAAKDREPQFVVASKAA